MMAVVTNCPNCGAVVHDSVCEYCGTVFQADANRFIGKDCLFVLVYDDGFHFMDVNVREIRNAMPTTFYTDDAVYFEMSPKIEITGMIRDAQAASHQLRMLKESLGDF